MIGQLLRGDRIRLAAIMPGDEAIIAGWYADAQFMRLFDAETAMPRTAKEIEEYLTGQQKSTTAFPFAIRLIEEDRLIGYIEIDGIMWNQGVGWVALGIGEAVHRGQGFGEEAMRLALAFAFGELNLRRVQLTVFSYNTPAIRLYEKIGFVREGVFREALQRDGRIYDMLLYGLLRREWQV